MARGGKRPGAGRPKGAKDVLPHGTVKAIVALAAADARCSKDATEKQRQAVELAYGRVADVLGEQVHYMAAGNVLKAAAMVADAVAGKQVERLEVHATVTLAELLGGEPEPEPEDPS